MVEICAKAAVGNPEELGDCPFCQRVIVTLKEKDVDYQLNLINLDDKPQWFIDECPSGEVPAMKHEGRWVDDVQIIIGMIEEWYPEPRLATPDEFAEAEHRFQNLYGYFVGFLQSQDPNDGTLQGLQEELNALDEHLGENGPFIAGEDFTAVDINVVPLLVNFIVACNHFKDYNFFEDMPNIRTYCESMWSRSSITDTTPADEYIIAGWEQKLNR
uniref:glutathione S-transferase DHAR2-like n=1 Tax=Fragaria vesca subsp. vesca TaxID=101020 RepID=UPI0005CB77B5|nr:PREDICTED: glutathione S-transferase DHAR2-like [Fragaria vesca subsp. vesca]